MRVPRGVLSDRSVEDVGGGTRRIRSLTLTFVIHDDRIANYRPSVRATDTLSKPKNGVPLFALLEELAATPSCSTLSHGHGC